jgi:hypothetical protein
VTKLLGVLVAVGLGWVMGERLARLAWVVMLVLGAAIKDF